MQKLKGVIEQHGRWKDLELYIERIEAYVQVDFSHSLENAKALLEAIGKEICSQRNVELGTQPSMQAVLKKAFGAIGYDAEQLVTQVSTSLATIGQQMGTLRNAIGPTAHGRTLNQIKERNDRVDMLTRELLLDTTEIVASLLIRGYESEFPLAAANVEQNVMPEYLDCKSFNDFWEETFSDYEMGSYSFTASEVLFALDPQSYKAELQAYNDYIQSGEQ